MPLDEAVEAMARLARAPRCSDWGHGLTNPRLRALLDAALPHLSAREVAQTAAGGPVPGAGPGIYWCCACGLNPVDANQGFDTCPECTGGGHV